MPYKDDETRRRRAKEIYRLNPQKQIQKTNKRRMKIKKWFQEYRKTLRCNRCPENHPATLDFYHKNREEKESCVTAMISAGRSKENILKEIAKCEVLCSNCHRKESYVNTAA